MNTLKGKNSTITILENSIKIEPRGWRGTLGGRSIVEVPFDKIKGVEFLKPNLLMFGFLSIIVGDGSKYTSSNKRTELMGDPYSVPFSKKQLKEFEEMRDKINSILNSKNSNSSQSSSPDVLEQIEKLSKLKDSGVLTENEFNTKKEELLKKL